MKRKFDGYNIDVCNRELVRHPDGSITLKVVLLGNIEIGLEIDEWTWRGDWLLKLFFKDNYTNYRIKNVQNNLSWNSETKMESNYVIAEVREWR